MVKTDLCIDAWCYVSIHTVTLNIFRELMKACIDARLVCIDTWSISTKLVSIQDACGSIHRAICLSMYRYMTRMDRCMLKQKCFVVYNIFHGSMHKIMYWSILIQNSFLWVLLIDVSLWIFMYRHETIVWDKNTIESCKMMHMPTIGQWSHNLLSFKTYSR